VLSLGEYAERFKGLTVEIEEMVYKLVMLRIERYGVEEVLKQLRVKLENILLKKEQ
jgi:Ni,Fe-hydrogenase III component G